MDRLCVDGIEFHGFHGVPEAERQIGHRYRVDLVMELDLRPAGLSDDVAQTVDYGEAARMVVEIGTGPGVRLVETLAERLAAALLERYPRVEAVEIRVSKIHPPVAVPMSASRVEIRRTRGR